MGKSIDAVVSDQRTETNSKSCINVQEKDGKCIFSNVCTSPRRFEFSFTENRAYQNTCGENRPIIPGKAYEIQGAFNCKLISDCDVAGYSLQGNAYPSYFKFFSEEERVKKFGDHHKNSCVVHSTQASKLLCTSSEYTDPIVLHKNSISNFHNDYRLNVLPSVTLGGAGYSTIPEKFCSCKNNGDVIEVPNSQNGKCSKQCNEYYVTF